jgi:phage protein D
LRWGADLLSFKPEVNLGNQVSRVEVHSWDETRKEKILGVARADQGKNGAIPGGDIQRRAFGKETVLELRFPVKSKQEADQRAAAELAKRTNDLVKGEGETFGFPELLPDRTLALTGLGSKFSATYYVTKTVHRYDTSGYRTRFSIERPVA